MGAPIAIGYAATSAGEPRRVPGRWVHRTTLAGADAGKIMLGRVGGNRPPARPTACRLPPAAAGPRVRRVVEGLGCGFPLLAPFLIAVAYKKVTVHQEPDWDFAYDCLVTQGPAGRAQPDDRRLRALAAMPHLYGAPRDTSRWPIRSRGRARPSPTRFRSLQSLPPTGPGSATIGNKVVDADTRDHGDRQGTADVDV